MRAVALHCQGCSGHRLDGTERITLDAGDLDRTRNWIACHAQMIFKGDLGGIPDLLGDPPITAAIPAAAIAAAYPTSPRHSTSAPEMKALCLMIAAGVVDGCLKAEAKGKGFGEFGSGAHSLVRTGRTF